MSATPPFATDHQTTALPLDIPHGLMVEAGECYLVRRSPGCGCCPEDAAFFGPWKNKKEAEAFAAYQKESGDRDYRDRYWTVRDVRYEVAGPWIILRDHYATKNQWFDGQDHTTVWDKELEDFERFYPGV